MSLTFFADHCVSKEVINSLESNHHKVHVLRDHIPQDSPDSLVIKTAFQLNSILISLNGDFSDIVTYPPSNYRGIVSLQIKNHPEITKHIVNKLYRIRNHT